LNYYVLFLNNHPGHQVNQNWLQQIAMEYFICDNCKEYYRLTAKDMIELQYVQNRQEWKDADCWPGNGFFPYPIGFDTWKRQDTKAMNQPYHFGCIWRISIRMRN